MRVLFPLALVALTLALACGRIGFDRARDDRGGDVPSPLLDAADLDAADLGDATELGDAAAGDDAAAACGWQPCATGFDACCVGAAGMCVATGTCTGATYACDSSLGGRCPSTKRCCMLPGGGSVCINLNTICDPM